MDDDNDYSETAVLRLSLPQISEGKLPFLFENTEILKSSERPGSN